jgi:hypothetical protein
MALPMRPVLVLSVAVAVVAGACGPGDPRAVPPDDAVPEEGLVEVEEVASTAPERVPSALDDPTAEGLPRPTIDVERLLPGGSPPDGIPAIDRPLFHPAGDVDFLDDREPVVAVEVDGDARAYPVQS